MLKIANFRRFLICGLLGLLLTGVVSCLKSPNTKAPQLEFWTMQLQPKFNRYFKDAIGTFEVANPGTKVNWVDVPWGAMQGKIQAALMSIRCIRLWVLDFAGVGRTRIWGLS